MRLRPMQIQASTRIYGIIGHPVAHSLSPLFQNDFLHQHAINGCYVAFPVEPTALTEALAGLWACGVTGINITVPHKELTLPLVAADDDARAIGAVNTLRRGDCGWQATNTDWIGLRQVIEALAPHQQPRSVLLFGAGGTARAVLHACHALNIPHLSICNRTTSRAEALSKHAKQQGYAMEITVLPWQQSSVDHGCMQSELLINTTTLGLHNGAPFPFSLPATKGEYPGVAIDAVYQPDGITPFVRAATQQKRAAIDGLPMLIAQGAASFYYWHALRPSRQQALASVCNHLHRQPLHMHGWEKNP
ncbi:MAG: shikimate dehydrogenase [Mariprofundales bacterium]|nr:shikimate dehydrogenase [Mariprofundales bacterium]